MSKLLELLEKRTLEWAREERERQDKAVEAFVAILRDQLIETESGLHTGDLRDGIAAMKSVKAADWLHPIRLGDLINKLVEQNHGSLSSALVTLTQHLGETIILIPGGWFADERTFEAMATLKLEDRFELPMTADGKAVDGAVLRAGYENYVRNAGRFPNVLVARSIGEGCGFRISLLSALGHPPELEANLEVRANERVMGGTFYLMVDEDKEDLRELHEARREAVRSGGEDL